MQWCHKKNPAETCGKQKKRRRQAEKRKTASRMLRDSATICAKPPSGGTSAATAAAYRLSGEQPDGRRNSQRRHSAKQNTAVGGTIRRAAALSQKTPLACRANSPTVGANSSDAVSKPRCCSRRDDRAMMTPGCAGRSELPFTSFPAQPKSARTRARRPQNHPYSAKSPNWSSMRSSWLYLATRSVRDKEPALICPALTATARSAITVSAVSPERWLTMT